jgi:hypothetical protein
MIFSINKNDHENPTTSFPLTIYGNNSTLNHHTPTTKNKHPLHARRATDNTTYQSALTPSLNPPNTYFNNTLAHPSRFHPSPPSFNLNTFQSL